MHKKSGRFATTIISLITIIAVGVFASTIIHALWYAPDSEIPAPALAKNAPGAAVSASAFPAHLRVPSLGISANVQDVGIAKSGNMGVPNNFTDVAWYKYGTVPGQSGSAVIDGHVDNGLSLDGVFKHLNDIKIGDDIYIDTVGGQSLHFVVSDIQLYNYKNVPTQTIFNQTDTARLNLITCDGAWVQGEKTYDHRLVVYTKLVNS